MAADITSYKRDTYRRTLRFRDGNGDVIDITGGTIWFTLKNADTDPDASAVIQKKITSHSDPTNGLSPFLLTSSDTDITVKTYAFDFQYKASGGDVATLKKGTWEFLQDNTYTEVV